MSPKPPTWPAPAGEDFDVWGEHEPTSSLGEAWQESHADDGAGSIKPSSAFGWDDEPAPQPAPHPARSVPEQRTPSILVVCTGNVCRSPYIERRLAHELADLDIAVTSAGTSALEGHGIEPGSQALLDDAGVSAEGFAARQLTEGMVESADLVLTATRQHRREVAQLAPVGLRKTFALADFADLVGSAITTQPGTPGLNPVESVVLSAELQRGDVHPRVGDEADIVDPFRQGPDVFARMQAQADASIDVVVRAIRAAASAD